MRHRLVAIGVGILSTLMTVPAFAAPPDGGVVDDTVRDVLNRPGYAGLREGFFQRIRRQVQDWVFQRFADLFSGGVGSIVGYVLIAGLVLLAVVLTVRFVGGVRGGGTTAVDGLIVDRTQSRTEWLAEAARARAVGDLPEAIRCAFRALIAGYAVRGLVEEIPGRTVGEYRRAVALTGSSADQEAFGRAAVIFEETWYANHPADDDDVEVVVAAAQQGGRP